MKNKKINKMKTFEIFNKLAHLVKAGQGGSKYALELRNQYIRRTI